MKREAFPPLSFVLLLSQWIRPQGPYLFCHLFCRLNKLPGHCRRQVEHTHPFRLQADFPQQCLGALDPALGVGITFQVMAVAGQSARHHYAVRATLQGLQHH